MDEIKFESVKYLKDPTFGNVTTIKAVIDSKTLFVPLAEGNRHYDEIMRQVEAGILTIEEAD
jgi:hypothetical protein